MAHVLHLIETLEHGGAERVVAQLATEQRRQHRVTMCCLKRSGPLEATLPDGVELLCMHKGEGDDPRVIWRLARELRRRDVDIVHTHAWGVFLEGGLAAWWARVPRLVHTAHGPYRTAGPGLLARVRWRARRWLERRVAGRFEALVGVSESVSETMRRMGFDGRRIHTVRNGIPTQAPRVQHGRRQRFQLITVGRLDAVKNQLLMLEAVGKLAPRIPQLRLRIVGDGPERPRLEARARSLGITDRVEILGFRTDVETLLAQADVFLLTSRHEGISIALLEAMRAGLPVIATNVGGVSETIIDGQSGVLVPCDGLDELCGAIELLSLSTGERQRLGANAAARVASQFSVESMTRAYASVYEGMQEEGGHAQRLVGANGSRPLEILVHHRTQGRGAEGVHIASIVNALEGMGHRVTVLSPPGIDPLATAGAAPVDKVRVSTRGTRSLWKAISRRLPGIAFEVAEIGYNALAWWRLRRALAMQRYDLVYERYAFYMVAGAWLASRYRIPFVLEANEVNGLRDRARRQWMPRLCGAFERFVFRRCDAVLTVSSYLRDLAVYQGLDPVRVRVVPNAIDPADLKPVARDPELLSRYGLRGRTVMGFAGWLDRWDRLDLLLDALVRLRPRHPELAVLLIGDGPLLGALRERARALGIDGAVITCGAVPRDAIQQHLALLDIAVLPHSNRFGSPVVMFELMARRVPIVAPRLAPIEDVLVDGETALLFDPLDGEQMVGAIERYLEDPGRRARTAARAFEVLALRHTWRQNASVILEAGGFTVDAGEARRAS